MTTPVIFRHSDVANPYGHYMHMLDHHPAWYDARQQLCIVYSYAHCKYLLHHPAAVIPPLAQPIAGALNPYAQALTTHLVRLSNGAQHAAARTMVLQLFHAFQPPAPESLVESLLTDLPASGPFDWMHTVARRLPALQLLQGYHFPAAQQQLALQYLRQLVQVMLPVKTAQQVAEINEAATLLYPLAEEHIDRHPALAAIVDTANDLEKAAARRIAAVNLLGLLIQAYDAGRGLLGTALLDRFAFGGRFNPDTPETSRAFVLESLRYHPPIHQTRRLLQDSITLGNTPLPAGTLVILMLAAANRDPAVFEAPEQFDPARPGNKDHLSFGSGAHACIAQHTIVPLTASVLHWLFKKYPRVRLIEEKIDYEPLINARIPNALAITLS